MEDLHSINDAINRRAGRKLGPSILVSLSLIVLVWFSLAFEPIIFAALVTLAVALGIREISRAFGAANTKISTNALILATIGLSAATGQGASQDSLSLLQLHYQFSSLIYCEMAQQVLSQAQQQQLWHLFICHFLRAS